MGRLTLPSNGLIYIDTMTLIYTVEQFPAYWPVVEPLWLAGQSSAIEIVTSELTILECLTGPIKTGNTRLFQIFEQALFGTGIQLLPITQDRACPEFCVALAGE